MTGWTDLAQALKAEPDDRLSLRDLRLEEMTGEDDHGLARHVPRRDGTSAARRQRERILAYLFGHLPLYVFGIDDRRQADRIRPLACSWTDGRPVVTDGSIIVTGGEDGALLARDGWVESWHRGQMLRRWRGHIPEGTSETTPERSPERSPSERAQHRRSA